LNPQDHQATTEAGRFDLSRHTLAAGGGGGHLIFLFFLHFVLVVT
jgi:hypothetical protein